MRCFWDERQRAHAPAVEFFNGALHPAAEHDGRVDSILAAIGRTEAPADHGMAPLLAVHDTGYLDFLQRAHRDWLAAGRTGEALPYAFPVVGRRPLRLGRIDAELGRYAYDTTTPIGPASWEAAYWGAQTALAALGAVRGGDHAFAFCRPPGHHAGADYCGGYSYLNNAAICAVAAGKRVAVLDIDYHHGNGTQDMLAGREGIRFASLHADPATDYPFYWGHADESGGNFLNLPLPRGTAFDAYDAALVRALGWLAEGSPELLVISFGADTYVGDPISHFALDTPDYARLARRIAAIGLPTLIVMEGGYAVHALGDNVATFLGGF
ncbi:histone deacetylase family protein [Sphingomonas sp. BN140010]|uniref:Histone deacetylase family protein n=1 Tax=Sphingomonas arvum TaxID=2992113 RepID=A0ABT3JGN8_9SPHN|nr:histone deacetylase family protein [Sphingomonas sp. BN140010]MCW3797905.1 histone deacetylase family protein [Sphingomonas sp. BN140010]